MAYLWYRGRCCCWNLRLAPIFFWGGGGVWSRITAPERAEWFIGRRARQMGQWGASPASANRVARKKKSSASRATTRSLFSFFCVFKGKPLKPVDTFAGWLVHWLSKRKENVGTVTLIGQFGSSSVWVVFFLTFWLFLVLLLGVHFWVRDGWRSGAAARLIDTPSIVGGPGFALRSALPPPCPIQLRPAKRWSTWLQPTRWRIGSFFVRRKARKKWKRS